MLPAKRGLGERCACLRRRARRTGCARCPHAGARWRSPPCRCPCSPQVRGAQAICGTCQVLPPRLTRSSHAPPCPPSAAATFTLATLVAAVVALLVAVVDSHLTAAEPEVVVGPSPDTKRRLDAAPSLKATYRAFPGLRNQHVVRSPVDNAQQHTQGSGRGTATECMTPATQQLCIAASLC